MWLLWRLAYVFLNPVKAGLVDRAEDYPWSGFRSFMSLEGSPLEVAPLPELAAMGKDLPDAQAFFLRLMKEQQAWGADRGSTTPTAGDIQTDQFEWIRRQAELRSRSLPAVDPVALALWWGRETGVPTRVMARVLGLVSSDAARQRIGRFKDMLDRDETLARRMTL